jgi:hypothetical protein
MTKARSRLFAVGVLSALVLAISPMLVQAQSPRLIAKIPFGFHIGDQEFPAGEYTVSRITNDNKVVHVSDGEGHTLVSIAIPASRSPANLGKLIFNRYGDEYFLSEVRWRQSEAALQFKPSSREQELAKANARQLIAIRDKRP